MPTVNYNNQSILFKNGGKKLYEDVERTEKVVRKSRIIVRI